MLEGFSAKQQLVFRFPYSKTEQYDGVICDGAVRSGKTSSALMSFILWAMATFKNQAFGICAKSLKAGERNLITPLLQIQYLRMYFNVQYRRGDAMLVISRGNTQNYFYMYGGVDESSREVIQGLTLAGLFLDEVPLMPRSFVDMAISRCSVDGAKVYFCCNPENPSHWFKTDFVDKAKQKGYLYIHFDMDDNPSLTEKTKQFLRAQYDGVFYQRYILGKWTKAEGLIYLKFADDNNKYILEEIPTEWVLYNTRMGVDFGGNKSKTTFSYTGFYKDKKNKTHIVALEEDEVIHENQQVDTAVIQKRFKAFQEHCFKKYGRTFYTRADSAEQVIINSLKRVATRTVVKNARKSSILGRILFLNQMLGIERFHVMKWCSDTISAINEACWNEKKPDERLDDGSTNVDRMDALEYSFEEDIKRISLESVNVKIADEYQDIENDD